MENLRVQKYQGGSGMPVRKTNVGLRLYSPAVTTSFGRQRGVAEANMRLAQCAGRSCCIQSNKIEKNRMAAVIRITKSDQDYVIGCFGSSADFGPLNRDFRFPLRNGHHWPSRACPFLGHLRTIAKTHASYGLDRRVSPLVTTSLENALMPSPDLDRCLVRYPDAVPYKNRQQRDRDADERGPDEEPDEARMLDREAREPGQNAAGKGAERGQQAELARRMLH
jgi:hypothetical protein